MAGMSVVDKFITSLTDAGDHYNILVDLLGFDGWPAAFALNKISKGNKWATGTVCHTAHETAFVAEITSNKIFSLARDGPLALLYLFLHKYPRSPGWSGIHNPKQKILWQETDD